MRLNLRFLLAATWCIGACGALPAWGARPSESPKVAQSPAETGKDFDLQGEYTGLISGGWRREPVGLQVMSLGGGEFAAVEYPGGLPGAGWDGQERLSAQGKGGTSSAILAGDRRKVALVNGELWLRDGDGILRGLLKKSVRSSPTLGLAPPPGATMLFNGAPSPYLKNERITPDGLLMEGAITELPYQDFFLHVEFRLPYMPEARGQGRANSGIYIQERYEVQILDSFGLEGLANECGGLYKTREPDLNMCLPPLTWQTYEISFRAARFDDEGKKTENARITVVHNGVPVQNNVEIPNKTGAGRPEGPEPRPIKFQDHSNPVRFRNVWIVDRSASRRGVPATAVSTRMTPPEEIYFAPGASSGAGVSQEFLCPPLRCR
ncbi:MAG: DUF1080 domain-containing protein [Pirellulales bacterium]|nr:DUF1080 domain-containing protein [Pirellulales bacterium]